MALLILNNRTPPPLTPPPAELRQRCAELLVQRKSSILPAGAIRRLTERRGNDPQAAITEPLREALQFIVGAPYSLSPSRPIRIARGLLVKAELVTRDSLGSGFICNLETHDETLEGLQQIHGHSESSDAVYAPSGLLLKVKAALTAALSGRKVSQVQREQVLTDLRNAITHQEQAHVSRPHG